MTAPEPTPCPKCDGAGVQTWTVNGRTEWGICEGCRCSCCGKYTDMAPECGACAIRADNDERRRDG
jgi:hypothetical protein